jgi:hypothetical protein
LEHLDVHIALSLFADYVSSDDMWAILNNSPKESGATALQRLRLKSLRITTEIESDYVLSTNPDGAGVVAWLKRLESRLIGPALANDDQGFSVGNNGATSYKAV